MDDSVISREELFEPVYKVSDYKPKPRKPREIIGASETGTVNQLCSVQSVTVFGEMFLAIYKLAQEKNINLYVYRRDRGERYKHRYYWGIFAVKAGSRKASHPKELTNMVASIEDYPYQVNHRRSSKQYKLLQAFLQELTCC